MLDEPDGLGLPCNLCCISYNPKEMLKFFTSGESHGEALVAFLSGLPAGLTVDPDIAGV